MNIRLIMRPFVSLWDRLSHYETVCLIMRLILATICLII